jgi:hypothetical protein
MNIWEQGGSGCNVAALQFAAEEEAWESCPDDGLSAAAVAGGLRQASPASFHQQVGVLTRRASRQQELQQEEVMPGPGHGEAETAGGAEGAQEAQVPEHQSMFQELRRITPSSSYAIIAIDTATDAGLLEELMRTGAETALSVLKMPSMSLKELLLKARLSLLPAATVMASPAALSAALSCNRALADKAAAAKVSSSVAAPGTQVSRSSSGGLLGGKLLPSIPYLDNSAFKLFDERTGRSLPKLRLLLDSGADGAILVLHVAEPAGLEWTPSSSSGVATAEGGTARPKGLLQGVKLLLLPGTPDATTIAYSALVMDTGGRGVYDAILGREQMHLLGMVMDFGRQKCYIRPKLSKGVMDPVEVPWTCFRPGRGCAAAGAMVASSGWEGEQEAHLMASGDVEANPGPNESDPDPSARLGGRSVMQPWRSWRRPAF